MDMCVGKYEERLAQQESGAALSNSSTYVSLYNSCYYTRCALIRTDGRLLHMQFRLKQRVFKYCVSTLGTFRW